MLNFNYENPVKILFGSGRLSEIGEQAKLLGAANVMLVSYENPVYFQDAIESIHQSLARYGISCVDYFAVSANPTLAQAQDGVDVCRQRQCPIDLIIGLGGGSVMDCAKVIAAGVLYPHELSKMLMLSHSNIQNIAPTESIPTMMIPTLPATGSEMNPTAVITVEETGTKSYVWEPCLYPKVAILDPQLTVGLPPYQSFCGAIDIISHVAEAYLNGNPKAGEESNNLSLQDKLQEGVMLAVLENMPVIRANPKDLQARGVLMWAASMALNGWLNSGTHGFTPMHQMGHVLSARYHATHGATLACMMVAWMKYFSKRADGGKYRQFAQNVFGCSLEDAIVKLEALLDEYGIQKRISEFGAVPDDIDYLTAKTVEVSFDPDGKLNSNPRLSAEEIKEIFILSI